MGLGIDLQQVLELLAPLIPAAQLDAVQQGTQLCQFLSSNKDFIVLMNIR